MKPATVFLIDDDTDDQEIFGFAMERADNSVQCVYANDGMHALEKLNSEESFIPDYIFIDMNMPRMNGQQCLKEIKKIARLKNSRVFMYSTYADPVVIKENINLGAIEFIVKPPDINDLTKILRRIIKQNVIALIIFCFGILPGMSIGQTDTLLSSKELKKLSVEQLMNIVVTSVSKSPEKLSEVASAIQVVTGDEIRRSGTLRLPGALRLATNLQVSSSGSHDTRISSRGFNGFPITNSSLANKLLVLIDGRTVYTPLFGGVFWDVQNVMQEDIRQIEVISGPGGALWGANAVNGIVNIISKSAKETQGVYVSGAAGGLVNNFGAARYGSHIDSTFFYRVYGQRFDYGSTALKSGVDARDSWYMNQGGFRMDYIPSANSTFTLQGDLYKGKEDDTASTLVHGQNIIGRWTRSFSDRSGVTIQTYFDRTFRNIKRSGLIDELSTFDFDAQHNFNIGKRNKMIWGLGYRVADDKINSIAKDFVPANRTLQLFNGFIQDQIAIVPDHLELTLGTKILHNDYTNFEFHPTIRLAWIPNFNNTLWAAVSRAVRTPSRFETDHPSGVLGSFGDFKSEKVISYEIGYRARLAENVSLSVAAYYNQYTDLRSVDSNRTAPPLFYFGNNLEANTYGVEISSKALLADWWKIRGGYTWLHEKFKTTASTTFPLTSFFEAIDPKNQFLIQSLMEVTRHFQVDGTIRYVDRLPPAISLPAVPAYLTFDLRLGYNYKWMLFEVIGSNLADKFHESSGGVQIQRRVFARATFKF